MLADDEQPLESGEKVETTGTQPKKLARRSVKSATWNITASVITLPTGVLQTIILARLLPVEYFGVFAGMSALVVLTSSIFEWGLKSAFIHRSLETQDEETAAPIFFTLRLLFCTAWALLSIGMAFYFIPDLRGYVLLLLTIITYLTWVLDTPSIILIRRVQHRRLAVLDVSTSLLAFILSALVAWFTRSIWSLLVNDIVVLLGTIFFLYIWKPVWRPRLAWDKAKVKYFINFGIRTEVGSVIKMALDRVDDLWTNYYLGDLLMGYYSKAYSLAIYPRMLLASPINSVTTGTYAELKYDRKHLSLAFNKVNYILVRSGFFLGGWLAVIAPHAIVILLGERWLPMLEAFRLMLVYTLFDPLKLTIANVLITGGKPEKVSYVRAMQLVILVVGLFTLGSQFGIAGVALAVDLMLVVGIFMLLYYTREFVDFSIIELFLNPTISLVVSLGITSLVSNISFLQNSDWIALIIKSVVFGLIFVAVLLVLESRKLILSVKEVWHLVLERRSR